MIYQYLEAITANEELISMVSWWYIYRIQRFQSSLYRGVTSVRCAYEDMSHDAAFDAGDILRKL
jgi:hypothetical protein